MSVFKDATGTKTSAKRYMGVLYLIMGLLMVLIEQVFNKKIDFENLLLIIGTGAGLLGLGLFEYFGKTKNIDLSEKK